MNDQNLPSPKSTTGSDLVFSGKGAEFFGIWIVNILLSICTLGVYSAWAKVRTTNYFYGNTKLGGSPFVYTANPISILKGRLIAFLLLLSYSLLSQYSPELSIGLIILIALLSPVVIVRALKFRFQNTEFRGLSFNFKGKVSEAYKIFLGGYILAMISLGILFPWWEKRRKEFYVGNIRFGISEFSCNPQLRFFYETAAMIIVVFIFLIVSFIFFGATFGPVLVFLIYPIVGILGAYWFSKITNHIFENTQLDGVRFKSELDTFELLRLWIVNILLLVFTFGLATPWVMVRNARYRISKTKVIAENIDSFIADQSEKISGVGEEIGEAFDIDLAL
tara:strand:+ start:9539 stop:10543 length:1005 start_codon:yes stop_codon:yes gene_type:complete